MSSTLSGGYGNTPALVAWTQSLAIAQARLAIVHAMHRAVRTVDLVFHAAGTSAIYNRNPLERYFRDIHVAVQHNSAFPAQI